MGESHLDAITVAFETDSGLKTSMKRKTDSLFVFIGADAETDWLPEEIACDENGYLLTGSDVQAAEKWSEEHDLYLLETSVPVIFSAGDVRHGSVKRVASGLGEGSMAVTLIHQFLCVSA